MQVVEACPRLIGLLVEQRLLFDVVTTRQGAAEIHTSSWWCIVLRGIAVRGPPLIQGQQAISGA